MPTESCPSEPWNESWNENNHLQNEALRLCYHVKNLQNSKAIFSHCWHQKMWERNTWLTQITRKKNGMGSYAARYGSCFLQQHEVSSPEVRNNPFVDSKDEKMGIQEAIVRETVHPHQCSEQKEPRSQEDTSVLPHKSKLLAPKLVPKPVLLQNLVFASVT